MRFGVRSAGLVPCRCGHVTADLHGLTADPSFASLPSNLLALADDWVSQLKELASGLGFNAYGDYLADQLTQDLNLGAAELQISGADNSLVLETIGRDLLVFLTASVFVVPAARMLGITPILLYLIVGALLGPHGGLNVFSNSAADVELGDFGILFLLFSEGLEISRDRLQQLTLYLPLGLAQLSLTAGSLTAAILLGAPELLERFLPLDAGLINIRNPVEAFVLALAGTLSTSAFVFPVLKEKGWEESQSGQAATSILLLQDLAVAPLLVLLPFVVGQGVTDPSAVIFLTAKATIGFGVVIALGSVILRQLFELVVETRSSETFVALSLLVSVGMGVIAKDLGLTDTAGAFAAGVLLANTNYRAQIQADILPFKGILLGIFFMDAGSSFDLSLVAVEWPTVLTGAISLILLKAVTLALATRVPRWIEPNRLPPVEGARLALLLSGGGEFAFVVLALAEKLGAFPVDLGGLLTAVVLVSMSLTPLLGDIAEYASAPLVGLDDSVESRKDDEGELEAHTKATQVAKDAIVICGFGERGRSLFDVLQRHVLLESGGKGSRRASSDHAFPAFVAFETDVSLMRQSVRDDDAEEGCVCYGDGGNPELLRASGICEPTAIFITYGDHTCCLGATSRLRSAFGAQTPIFTRSQTRMQAQALKQAGATEVVVENEELSRSALALIRGSVLPPALMASLATGSTGAAPSLQQLAVVVARALGVSEAELPKLLEFYASMDVDASAAVTADELRVLLTKSNTGPMS
eukprot:CAMPEP_0119314988 /NCGR_PEP_ID=MMETSP1333-20130426/34143_1 /TAXON_ID=418940 /ORGANISM="Scyphosphaera apsteinii, Strain RCC1455" /LENGTH=755 /DNA_ID=CAMNT_0007320203 /DNA_START=88 /DNA_END=2355 /DNA_ORIENTATION=+